MFHHDIQHDNLHFVLPNGDTLSVASINGCYEVAVLRTSSPGRAFVPTMEWLGEGDEDVFPIINNADVIVKILGTAIKWAEWEKVHLIAHALDQAL